jgi:phage shock protein A
MDKEAAALRADIARYRRSLLAVNDPKTTKMLEQMIKDAQARLDAVEGRDLRQST